MKKNIPKYLSYKTAWSRINIALESGYYLEAVTIEESIISDRLLSYLSYALPSKKLTLKTSFGKIISLCRKETNQSLIMADGKDLGVQLDAWRKKRNQVIHGLVKSAPGQPTEDVDDFLALAEKTAHDGKALARKFQDWHRAMKRDSKGN